MNLVTVRKWQIDSMELSIRAVEALFKQADKQAIRTYRDNGTGWTALEVLGHLRDFEAVIFQRIRLMVEEENPALPFPDPDELARAHNYNNRDWTELMGEWQAERATHIAYLQAREESDWERPGQHPTRGAFTAHDQLFLTSLHDVIHIEQITRILDEQKLGG